MRGIMERILRMALIICASAMVLALGGTNVNGAIQEVEEPTYVYTCEEGVWYKMVENETIKVITTDGESRNMVFTMQYVYEEPENPAWSFGMNILIRQQLEDGFIDIGEDIWTCRGIYMMEYDGTLYFAACVWDINEDPQTYVWWEGGTDPVCMAGELDKTECGINVRQKLYGNVENVSAVNVGKPMEQSENATYVYGGERYTLSRPLLVASEPSLEADTEMILLDAGANVESLEYMESDGYHWYFIETEDEVGGWMPLDDDGHLILQDADFSDVFALRGSDITIHKSLNDSWLSGETEIYDSSGNDEEEIIDETYAIMELEAFGADD